MWYSSYIVIEMKSHTTAQHVERESWVLFMTVFKTNNSEKSDSKSKIAFNQMRGQSSAVQHMH